MIPFHTKSHSRFKMSNILTLTKYRKENINIYGTYFFYGYTVLRRRHSQHMHTRLYERTEALITTKLQDHQIDR